MLWFVGAMFKLELQIFKIIMCLGDATIVSKLTAKVEFNNRFTLKNLTAPDLV